MPSPRALKRFFTYTFFGTTTSLLDISILWILTNSLGVHYLLSATISFSFSASLSYIGVRHFVFTHTHRSLKAGYLYFLMITGTGLALTLGGMAILVEIFNLHYMVARILIAGAIGLWNYLMNLYVNFKVAGRY